MLLPSGIITAAIERLQSGRLTREQRRAAMLLGGGSVHAPKKRLELPGKTRAERRAEADAIEAKGKAAARVRSGGICEWHTDGTRCAAPATDGDHVLGGQWKRDMEALPNGEGFMDLCRFHHEDKHGPGKPESLAVAREHALRIGARGLLRHVEAAVRRYEAKHPEARASLGKERVTR
jgi:hypothetical protein